MLTDLVVEVIMDAEQEKYKFIGSDVKVCSFVLKQQNWILQFWRGKIITHLRNHECLKGTHYFLPMELNLHHVLMHF